MKPARFWRRAPRRGAIFLRLQFLKLPHLEPICNTIEGPGDLKARSLPFDSLLSLGRAALENRPGAVAGHRQEAGETGAGVLPSRRINANRSTNAVQTLAGCFVRSSLFCGMKVKFPGTFVVPLSFLL